MGFRKASSATQSDQVWPLTTGMYNFLNCVIYMLPLELYILVFRPNGIRLRGDGGCYVVIRFKFKLYGWLNLCLGQNLAGCL